MSIAFGFNILLHTFTYSTFFIFLIEPLIFFQKLWQENVYKIEQVCEIPMITKLHYRAYLVTYQNGVVIVKNVSCKLANYSYYGKKIKTFFKQFRFKNLKSQVLFSKIAPVLFRWSFGCSSGSGETDFTSYPAQNMREMCYSHQTLD